MEKIKNTEFADRHIGPSQNEIASMLKTLNVKNLDELVDKTVPRSIRLSSPLKMEAAATETESLNELKTMASKNQVFRSYIGLGYNGTITPPVILRNILENPGWYTQYTPYQAEISQGRLEALLNFQTLVMDLTGLGIANASMLDEGTAAAEAMTLCHRVTKTKSDTIFVSEDCHPQTIEIVRTRAKPLGLHVIVGSHKDFNFDPTVFAVLVQYPTTYGEVYDYSEFADKAHKAGAMVIAAADLLSLTLLKAPAEWGADVAVGNTQRFGVPMGFGGPHAGYMATKDEFKRQLPGRLIGVSKDRFGNNALRLSLQPREQHIRREKATSNICTAQVLLAVTASMYAVYHGPKGLEKIARRVLSYTNVLATGLKNLGHNVRTQNYFDTIRVECSGRSADDVVKAAEKLGINLRKIDSKSLGISLDETVTTQDLADIFTAFNGGTKASIDLDGLLAKASDKVSGSLARNSAYLTHPVFSTHHSETEMLRYMNRLQGKDLSLTTSMIPLGSCTMKLNATAEMIPVTWDGFGKLHPFAPRNQVSGYAELTDSLEKMLAEITGFDAVSLQPNAGSQGEYSGLLAIREYHLSRGDTHRNVCLIPQSAHGTNPASAAMAGMKVVVVACDSNGNIDLKDLREKAETNKNDLSAIMVTYPSTHGVFEEGIRELCDIVHKWGGQVYMDGANMNAQVGLCRPGDIGADVCHLNLHKTFSIPHGGGGPGMGPIGVKKHLAPFLPSHPVVKIPGSEKVTISAAPWGSASVLPISWAYIRMMGEPGLKKATEVAILNANYIAHRLDPHYPVLYKGANGFVAHECIVDLRSIKDSVGIEVEDVAKRLMDYGFHAPTVSFPVVGTLMIEPTESENKAELDRFCDALISIREEIRKVEKGVWPKDNNPLKNAPHTAVELAAPEWNHPYSRAEAVFPAKWVAENKFWPSVGRVDNAYGDRNLVCSCLPIEAYT